MLLPLIGSRLHGWLDDLVALAYLLGVYGLGLHGAARITACGGALVHFLLTRFTSYRQGTFKVIPFRTHAFVELGEGAVVFAAALLLSAQPPSARIFLAFMSASQFAAFAFSDYGPKTGARPAAAVR